MIDKKIGIITIHDLNPSCSEKLQTITNELDNLKVKYNLSIVPFYNNKYNVKDDTAFRKQISSLCESKDTLVELTLHGLYHQLDGKIEDFDSQSKEQEKTEIQQGLDILSSAKLPKPSTFIPPAWHLSRQAIQALKDLKFDVAESMSDLEFIQKGKKYLLSPVLNWDKSGDKEKNTETLKQNKTEFYTHLFNIDGESYGLFRMAIHPPHDPDEALSDQIEMIKFLQEKENYNFVNYSDLSKIEEKDEQEKSK
jgi:predicted deacetylase